MPRKTKKKRRGVVDTNVLVAGVSGFKEQYVPGRVASADMLREWAEEGTFIWLVSEEILDEYKEILKRLKVRPALIGKIINLIRERAEQVEFRSPIEISPDPEDDAFCLCAEYAKADFLVTLNPADFPQDRLKAVVLSPIEMIKGL